jgi:hypothetical protein
MAVVDQDGRQLMKVRQPGGFDMPCCLCKHVEDGAAGSCGEFKQLSPERGCIVVPLAFVCQGSGPVDGGALFGIVQQQATRSCCRWRWWTRTADSS